MFENYKVFKTILAGRELIVEVGKIAQLANGSCLIRYGETVVNVAVTASNKPRDGIDFLPLSVDFEEKLYAIGKIPGSFLKREGRPSEKAILISRVIDRPIRPLFPKDLRNDISVVCTTLCVDPDCSAEVAAMIGTSIALSISDIPWNGPISGVTVGLVDNKFIINPTQEERKNSQMSITVASTQNLVAMIEAGANEIEDEKIFEGIMAGHKSNQQIIEFINKITQEIGKEKFSYNSKELSQDLILQIEKIARAQLEQALFTDDKSIREANLQPIYKSIHEQFDSLCVGEEKKIDEALYKIQKKIVRNWILEKNKRVDGRALDELRPLAAEVALLPRVHGSGLFTRGQTQVLTVATLGPISDQQFLDGFDGEEFKRYMHHYNFPPYSVGESRPLRAPGRREIGHGALAERALVPVIPSEEEFPYAIRLVSEVVSSNGSTSQGAICGSTLALMQAGVPIKAPVAGISCGLVSKGEKWVTMVDIQGLEDFFGDMDFKVAGTKKGITAIQMDLKIEGLTPEIIKEALEKTHKARNYILDEVMLKTIKEPNKQLSPYAPKMRTMKIPVEKIREVIGSGGKTVQKICADCQVKLDIEEDGRIFVSGLEIEKCDQALEIIKSIIFEPEIGAIYNGKVKRIMEFGAFIEIFPGKEGLCHISQIDTKRTEKVSDVLKENDEVFVKVTGVDEKGRINLSRREAIVALTPKEENK